MFQYTTAIDKIRSMTKRKKVIQGGTSAGKTYAIIPILIDRCVEIPGLKVTVVAETIPAVKDGAVDIFKSVMQDTKRWRNDGWIGNPMEYTFANRSRIQFKAFDDESKAKASGKRDILFINEGNHIDFKIADALMIRSKETYIDFNPDNEYWAHKEVMTEANAEFLSLTYLDNEALPEETLEDLLIKKSKAYHDVEGNLHDENNVKNKYWANWWQVYGLGELGTLQGVVFDNYEVIDQLPIEARLLANGLDFGYTNDPTACVALYKYNDTIIFDELIYQTGLTNPKISEKLKQIGVNQKTEIIADSAEPKSIDEIKDLHWRIYPCKKGRDSIDYGIQLLQQYRFLVTRKSVNLLKELEHYKWATDKSGESTGKPIDTWNHLIDAMRYVATDKLGRRPTASKTTVGTFHKKKR